MAQRILGEEVALPLFQAEARSQGKEGFLPDPTPGFLDTLEARLSGSVGAATAHAMIGQLVGRATVTVEDLMAAAESGAPEDIDQAEQQLLVEREGAVAVLTLNRPKQLNALSVALRMGMAETFDTTGMCASDTSASAIASARASAAACISGE